MQKEGTHVNRRPIVVAFVTANVLIGTAILIFALLNRHWWLLAAPLLLYGYSYLLSRWMNRIAQADDEDAQQLRQVALSINFVLMLFAMILFFIGLRFSVEDYMANKGVIGTCIVQQGCTEEDLNSTTTQPSTIPAK
jgi:hypothetical protein